MFNKLGCILLVLLCFTLGDSSPVSAEEGAVLVYVVADTETNTTQLVLHNLATDMRLSLLTHRNASGSNPVSAAVSDDGRIAYPVLHPEEYAYNIFVWDEGVLTDLGDGFNPVWSADGRLAFSSLRGESNALMVWDGQTLTDITRDEAIAARYSYQALWHSDGRLAFQGERALYLWDGQSLSTIAEGFLADGFAWRSDGCLSFGERGSAVQRSKLHLWCDGVLTTTEIPEIGNLHGDMAWSSDNRLALKITRTHSGDYDPAVYLWDGQTFTFVAETAYAYSFVWSADRSLAFLKHENTLELYVWQDGMETELGQGYAPAWNSDGRLAFDCGFWEICVWDGQTTVEIGAGTNPQWVPISADEIRW